MTRDIMFLVHRFPYPPDRGDRIRSWHVLQALARIAPVHVFAVVDEDPIPDHMAMVRSVAANVVVARPPRRIWAVANALWRHTPASVEAFRSAALDARVAECLRSQHIGCIYAFSGQMAACVPKGFAGHFLMDFVDLDSAKFDVLGGWLNREESRRLRRWETIVGKKADSSMFVSHAEASAFTRLTGRKAEVLENGVDSDYFDPRKFPSLIVEPRLIVFTGQMDYRPNVDAVLRFTRDILPHIDARFAIVGRSPTRAVRALGSDRVTVTGEVADVRPWLAKAAVVVAPLRLACGVQNKVLEAMAMGRPVVLSSPAATGIDACDGRDFCIDDKPAVSIRALLDDPGRAARMGAAARARMLARYRWSDRLAPLTDIVDR